MRTPAKTAARAPTHRPASSNQRHRVRQDPTRYTHRQPGQGGDYHRLANSWPIGACDPSATAPAKNAESSPPETKSPRPAAPPRQTPAQSAAAHLPELLNIIGGTKVSGAIPIAAPRARPTAPIPTPPRPPPTPASHIAPTAHPAGQRDKHQRRHKQIHIDAVHRHHIRRMPTAIQIADQHKWTAPAQNRGNPYKYRRTPWWVKVRVPTRWTD